jgi:hypothetical protein
MATINQYIKINNYNWKTSKNTIFPDKVLIYPDIIVSDNKISWQTLNAKIEIVFKDIKNLPISYTGSVANYIGEVGYVGSFGYIGSQGYKSSLPLYVDTEQYSGGGYMGSQGYVPMPDNINGSYSTVITDREIQKEFINKLKEIKDGYLLG